MIKKSLKLIFLSCLILTVAGCATPPKVSQPKGSFIPVNSQSTINQLKTYNYYIYYA